MVNHYLVISDLTRRVLGHFRIECSEEILFLST